VADPNAGLVLVGGGIGGAPLVSGLRGGYDDTTNGSQVRLGASVASQSNIVLTDTLTTINTSVNLAAVGADLTVADQISLGGNLLFTNGAAGASISGYQTAQIAVAAAGAQVNPVGLTPGVYTAVYVAPGAGNEPAQPAGVFVWSGTTWFGNAVSFNFTAGAPNCAICPTAGGATLTVGGAAVPLPATIFMRKMMN
jgi:hypothetical protein